MHFLSKEGYLCCSMNRWNNKKIVLCSASPRRQEILKGLGVDFEILLQDVDESFPHELKRAEVAVYLAEKKAGALKKTEAGKIYITADTIVCLDNEVLGKPVDEADAFRMLKKLSARAHEVHTAVCFVQTTGKETLCVKSEVTFKETSEQEIRFYIAQYQPFDKAGSYGAQECLPENVNPCSAEEKKFLADHSIQDLFEKTLLKDKKHMPMIEKIKGSYFNVMGLPVIELYQKLIALSEEPASK